MTDIVIGAIIGAVSAIVGGIIGKLIESWLLRKNKRNEYIAKLEVDACVWIYPLFKKIMGVLDHQNRTSPKFEEAEKIVGDNNAQFWEKRLLLPPGVSECWLGCRNAIKDRDQDMATNYAQKAFPKICKRFGLKEFP